MTPANALSLIDVSMVFGGLKAVNQLSLEIPKNQIFGIIGPNGAGKTTVFNMLTGVYTPTSGDILACGKSTVGKRPYEICIHGVSRTFQNIKLFKELTILDNILIALDQRLSVKKFGLLSSILRSSAYIKNEAAKRDQAHELLDLFGLKERSSTLSRQLPYGDQRRLEIARAVATGAEIILLDEPAAGMSAAETESLMQMIRYIRDKFDITVVLIEHDMHLVMNICEKIAVLDYGSKIAEGTPSEIKCNPEVIKAYLGEEDQSV